MYAAIAIRLQEAHENIRSFNNVEPALRIKELGWYLDGIFLAVMLQMLVTAG